MSLYERVVIGLQNY